jgi:cytochrome P450
MSMAPPAALADLDVEQPGFYLRDDYFELLAWLREHDPVHRSANGMVLLSRYDDIREVSRRPEAFSSRRGALINDPLRLAEPNDAAGSLLHLDPPIHAEYRKLLNREFTPRAVGRMEQAIRRITAETFDGLAGGDEVDLVERIAMPIPVRVIADLLGVADGDLADFRRWSDAVIEITDNPTPEVIAAAGELFGFLDGHVRQRFDAPGDDLLSMLATSQVGGAPLTRAQLQMFAVTLMIAGNETTRGLIAGGALALAEHADQRAALAAEPDRIGGAVEELLRWVTPIQAFCRTASTDAAVGGQPVGAGDYVVLLYASGNRDESAFGPTAGVLDVRRPPTPAHVAFGFGEHLCLGAALARLEARVVFEELLGRFPTYEVVAPATYASSTLTRNLASLPVRL